MNSGDSTEPSEASSTEVLGPGSVWSYLHRAVWGCLRPLLVQPTLSPLTGARATRGAPRDRWRPSWTTWPHSWPSSRLGRSSRWQAVRLKEECLNDFKQRLIDKANLIQARVEKVPARGPGRGGDLGILHRKTSPGLLAHHLIDL